MMAKMGGMSMTSTVQSIETGDVAAETVRAAGGVQDRRKEITNRTKNNEALSSYLSLLRNESTSVIAVELRPPRAELQSTEGMDAWIDTYHCDPIAHAQ